ncbi:MAG: cysteinyl-tRNA synthetase [Anaerolineae bacterium]
MTEETPGLVIMLGSGETLASSGKAHEYVAQHSPHEPKIVILETPAGFEPNSDAVAGKIKEFLERRLQNYKPKISVLPARKRGTEFSPDNFDVVKPILTADEILLGPGSPSYGAKQLRKSLALRMTLARHYLGSHLFLSSSSTLAFSRFTMPVYEIYKVGDDLHWKDGADFLGNYGLKTAVIPHWNNNDGGTDLDTSRCYMGQDRFNQLLEMLPEGVTVIGIDEHTSLILDFEEKVCKVMGNGTVTIIFEGNEQTFKTGSVFSIDELGDWHIPQKSQLPQEEFEMIAKAEQEASESAIVAGPSAEIQTLADERWAARSNKDWQKADELRDELENLGWRVLDEKDRYVLEMI